MMCTFWKISYLFMLHSKYSNKLTFENFDVCHHPHDVSYKISKVSLLTNLVPIGWLRLVGSLKLWVSFAENCLFYRALLQKRPLILRSLLVIATLYNRHTQHIYTHTHAQTHKHTHTHTHTHKSRAHTHTHTLSLSLTHKRTNTHTHTHIHTHTHTNAHTHKRTHSHTDTHTLSLFNCPPSLSLSLSVCVSLFLFLSRYRPPSLSRPPFFSLPLFSLSCALSRDFSLCLPFSVILCSQLSTVLMYWECLLLQCRAFLAVSESVSLLHHTHLQLLHHTFL